MRIREVKNKRIWEEFLIQKRFQINFLQSWAWGETHRLLGHKIFRFGFYQGDKIQGICLLIKQEAKRGGYLECPGGPIISLRKINYFKAFLNLIKKIGREENCLFIRVRPQLLNSHNHQKLFKRFSFLKAPMHLHAQDTWVLEINKDEESLLQAMRKTTRYLIRKALREGLEIRQSRDEKDLKILYQLQTETAQRHNFVPFPFSFFKAHFKAFSTDDQIRIFKAIWRKKVLACAMIVFYGGRAIYHYSASSSRFTQIPASYLLQWEAIKEAKKRNCLIYDFWGIAPENAPETHRFAGVTLFKKGFGGYQITYLPAQDLPLRWSYYLVYFFETMRRFWRRL